MLTNYLERNCVGAKIWYNFFNPVEAKWIIAITHKMYDLFDDPRCQRNEECIYYFDDPRCQRNEECIYSRDRFIVNYNELRQHMHFVLGVQNNKDSWVRNAKKLYKITTDDDRKIEEFSKKLKLPMPEKLKLIGALIEEVRKHIHDQGIIIFGNAEELVSKMNL
jgi:hypothetical protein